MRSGLEAYEAALALVGFLNSRWPVSHVGSPEAVTVYCFVALEGAVQEA